MVPAVRWLISTVQTREKKVRDTPLSDDDENESRLVLEASVHIIEEV